MTDLAALDLGDTAGFATIEGGRVRHGIRNFDILLNEHPGARWPRVRAELRLLLRGKKWCAWEQIVNSQGTFSKSNLFGLECQVVEVCCELGVEPLTVAPGSLKKFATCGLEDCDHKAETKTCRGSGKATKEELRHAGRRKWPGEVFETHDEIDALWVLEWGMWKLRRIGEAAPKKRATRRTT
jgi:hypothetical protein